MRHINWFSGAPQARGLGWGPKSLRRTGVCVCVFFPVPSFIVQPKERTFKTKSQEEFQRRNQQPSRIYPPPRGGRALWLFERRPQEMDFQTPWNSCEARGKNAQAKTKARKSTPPPQKQYGQSESTVSSCESFSPHRALRRELGQCLSA